MYPTLSLPCEEELAFLILAGKATWIRKFKFIFLFKRKAALYWKSYKSFAYHCVYLMTLDKIWLCSLTLEWNRKF